MMFRRRPWTCFVLACVAGFLALRYLVPGWAAFLPPCLLHRYTGLHCPGCGGTRCAKRLLAGDFPGAVAMNPLVVALGLLVAAVTMLGLWREWRGRDPRVGLPGWTGWALGAVVLGFGVLRNFPWWPFTWLAPG